jgi:hypothetical protein
MTIQVRELENNEFEITWDEKDLRESMFNTWTESDFLNAITEHLDRLKKDDGRTESTT